MLLAVAIKQFSNHSFMIDQEPLPSGLRSWRNMRRDDERRGRGNLGCA